MKKYLLILISLYILSYLATSLVVYDIVWILKIGSWSMSERLGMLFIIFILAVFSIGIKEMPFSDQE